MTSQTHRPSIPVPTTEPPHSPDRQPRRRRLLRFFQWNDCHVIDRTLPNRRPGYHNSNEKARWLRSLVNPGAEASIEPPDLIVSVGDLVHGPETCNLDADFALARELLLADLPAPLLPCVGNHENRQGEGDCEMNRPYDAFFGEGWHNYVATTAGLAFVVVDTSGAHRQGSDPVTDARLEFTRRALRRFNDRPLIIVTHVPLIPMRDREVLIESFGFSSWQNQDTRLLEAIEVQRDRVIAVLGGHLHLTGARVHNGIHHLGPSGTAGYPCDFASFDVFPDRVAYAVHAAPDHLVGPEKLGNIHGRARHGIDYTDAEHPDPETYVSGTPAERALVIELGAGKRPIPDLASEPLQVWRETHPDQWEPAAIHMWKEA